MSDVREIFHPSPLAIKQLQMMESEEYVTRILPLQLRRGRGRGEDVTGGGKVMGVTEDVTGGGGVSPRMRGHGNQGGCHRGGWGFMGIRGHGERGH